MSPQSSNTNPFNRKEKPMPEQYTKAIKDLGSEIADKVTDVAIDKAEELSKTPAAQSLVKKLVGSVIRTGLAALGGYLISKGLTDGANADALTTMQGPLTDMVSGFALAGIAQVWSIARKVKTSKALNANKTPDNKTVN